MYNIAYSMDNALQVYESRITSEGIIDGFVYDIGIGSHVLFLCRISTGLRTWGTNSCHILQFWGYIFFCTFWFTRAGLSRRKRGVLTQLGWCISSPFCSHPETLTLPELAELWRPRLANKNAKNQLIFNAKNQLIFFSMATLTSQSTFTCNFNPPLV